MKDIDSVPSNVQSARQEALLYVFEDNEAVIKMIIKGRSPTTRHVSRTHRVALDWLFNRINLDPKIQIKYIDTKNQLADISTKGNFTRDEWNHLLNLFSICHFSSTACTAAMAKRAQQGSGEEPVTAKSRPMMNLTARMPSVVSSSTSSNLVRTSYGYQDPGKSVALIADLEELETMDASEIYSKRLNAKEVIFPKQGEFIFPIADGRIKTPGEDGQEDGVSKAGLQQAAADSQGARTCVLCKHLSGRVAHAAGTQGEAKMV